MTQKVNKEMNSINYVQSCLIANIAARYVLRHVSRLLTTFSEICVSTSKDLDENRPIKTVKSSSLSDAVQEGKTRL